MLPLSLSYDHRVVDGAEQRASSPISGIPGRHSSPPIVGEQLAGSP